MSALTVNEKSHLIQSFILNFQSILDTGYEMSTLMHSSLLKLRSLGAPSAFLVDGRALGGGAELTLAPDWRIFTPSGKLSFVQANMGVATGWGGGARLAEIVGERNVSIYCIVWCTRNIFTFI